MLGVGNDPYLSNGRNNFTNCSQFDLRDGDEGAEKELVHLKIYCKNAEMMQR